VGVQKFRSIEQMNQAPVRVAAGSGFERFLRHCARYWMIAPRTYPRGLFRFRTLEEAQAARRRVSMDSGADSSNPDAETGTLGQNGGLRAN
jgi:hypothetical protein